MISREAQQRKKAAKAFVQMGRDPNTTREQLKKQLLAQGLSDEEVKRELELVESTLGI